MRVVLQVSNGKTNLKRVVIQSDTVIGRSTDCQLRVASSLVSRKHCQISVSDARVSVTDLGSANGTFLNGKPLPPNVPTELSSGSEVSIGPVQFLVQFQPPTAVEMPAFGDRYDSADSFSVDPEVHQAPAAPVAPTPAPVAELAPAAGIPAVEAVPAAEAPVETPAAQLADTPAPVELPPVEAPAAVSPEPVHAAAPSEPVAEVAAAAAPPAVVELPPPPVDPVFAETPAPPRPAVLVARVVARPVAPPAEPVAAAPVAVAPPVEPVAPPVETVAPAPPAPVPPAIDDSEQTITAFPEFAGLSSENADEAAAFDFLNDNASAPAPAVEINAAADDILEEPSMELTETAPEPAPAETAGKPKRGFWNMLGIGKKAPPQKEAAPAAAPPVEAPAEPVVGAAEAPGNWDFGESEPAPAEAPPAADAEAGGQEDDALNDFFKNLP